MSPDFTIRLFWLSIGGPAHWESEELRTQREMVEPKMERFPWPSWTWYGQLRLSPSTLLLPHCLDPCLCWQQPRPGHQSSLQILCLTGPHSPLLQHLPEVYQFFLEI